MFHTTPHREPAQVADKTCRHWQLRSVISADGNDAIYYPAGVMNAQIMRLDIQTRESEVIKVLNFHPRCMVAKRGWICCGGESGEFAVIRDRSRTEGSSGSGGDSGSGGVGSASGNSAEAAAQNNDFRTQLNALDSSLASDAPLTQLSRDMFNMLERRLNGPTRTWTTSSHKFGSERVNCITIWQPPNPTETVCHPKVQAYAGPVAVLANNDKTITMVGLSECECLDELEYPDCVNRGVLSPDGTMLAAITDDPYLYVHVRKTVNKGKTSERYEWRMLPRIRLKDQARQSSSCRGSFAACFSDSGRYLAIGTQYGTIAVYNVAAIRESDRDPLITWFYASRFPSENAAVRDMAFCPGPYDLLAWTEHRGRVGLADARSQFTQRQIVALDKVQGVEHVSLNERHTIDPRLLDHRNDRAAGAAGTSSSSHTPSQAQMSSLTTHIPSRLTGRTSSPRPLPNPEPADGSDRLNAPFSAEETAVLEAFQNERRRREAREARDQIGQHVTRGSAAWRSSVWADRVSLPSSSVTPMRSTLHLADQPADQPPLQTYREIAHMLRQQRETLTRILERERNRDAREQHRLSSTQSPTEQQDRERRAPTPRRRSSVMQALSQSNDNITQVLNRTQAAANNEPGPSRDSPTPWGAAGRLVSGWADLEALYNIGGGEAPENTSRAEILSRARRGIPVISDVWNDDLTTGFAPRQTYRRLNTRDHPQYPDDTAGLAWSEDGTTL